MTTAQTVKGQKGQQARQAQKGQRAPRSGPLPASAAKPEAGDAGAVAVVGTAARRPGRPAGSSRGPEQRERLLEVALTLFARQGIVDTTLGAIAREAGFTPAMVHYYFKTRDQLLDVLIDERIVPLRTSLAGPFDAYPDDPVAAIAALARRLVDTAREHPWFPSLWVREVISDGGLLKRRMRERFGDAQQRASFARITKWQKQGRLNPGLEPSLVFASLLGLTLLPMATSPAWRNATPMRKLNADDIARHAIALLTHGVGPLDASAAAR
jgi:AcrR family transcriptional regulator